MTIARNALTLTILVLAAGLAGLAHPLAAAEAADLTIGGESLTLDPSAGQVFSDSSANGGKALLIWSNATASGTVSTSGVHSVVVRARGDQCAGAPHMVVAVDGKTIISQDVASSTWAPYGADANIADGSHTVTVAFTNDYMNSGCDRNLRVDSLTFSSNRGVEGEAMSLPSANGQVFSDGAASGGQALLIWSNASATAAYSTTGAATITAVARGDQCAGAPHMVVAVDGKTLLSQDVAATSWTSYSANASLADGSHTFTVSFTNDYMGSGCDRNLRLDSLSVASAPPSGGGGGIPGGSKWYIDPYSNAKRQADAWRQSRPADAAAMDKIAAQPQADWFGDWSGDVQSAVSSRVSTITSAGALPVLVAYNIPLRDCSSYSGGGASSASAYRSWIRSFAAGIGSRRAVVVLEPDALAGLDCLSAADQSTRLSLLDDAVSVLAGYPGVATYIDAGNSRWHTADVIAGRLKSAGVARAAGFALNVSNYLTTSEERGYGDQVAGLVGGKHFMVDTSRNGLGPSPDNQWCNPPGRALGDRPTTATGDPLADAWFWIKRPGESDGTCNGGPAAGQWWADYALGLAQRAAY
jgi:endoglucanase